MSAAAAPVTHATIHSFGRQGGGEAPWLMPTPIPSPIIPSWMREAEEEEEESEDVVFSAG